MSDESEPPEKPPARGQTADEALRQMLSQNSLGRLAEGISAAQLSPLIAGIRLGLSGQAHKAELPESADSAEEALQPAIAGGEEKPKRKRSTQGKQLLHGADRTVRFYKITEAEIDRLGELSKDEKTAWTRMAFCFGLAVNVALGLLFGVGIGDGTRGAALALGVLAAIAGCRFWRDAVNKRNDGQSALDKIKGDHDFTNV